MSKPEFVHGLRGIDFQSVGKPRISWALHLHCTFPLVWLYVVMQSGTSMQLFNQSLISN